MPEISSKEAHQNLSDLFLAEVTPDLLTALLRVVLQSYVDASNTCYDSMRREQAKDATGNFRRNKIDSELVGVGERFKGRISAESKAYKNYTGSFVELTCGLIKMTQSCVLDPSQLPRDAEYRETLATDPQLLLEFMPKEPEGKYLYAVLLHGVDRSIAKRAACRFAQVRFPVRGFTGYTKDRIDLFNMFPDVIAEYRLHTADETETELLPLRVIPKIGEA